MKRRNFLQTALISTAATIPFRMQAEGNIKSKPKVVGLATNWGYGGTTEQFCSKSKSLGYDGVELWFPGTEKERKELLESLQKHKLEVGFLVGGQGPEFTKHFNDFKNALNMALAFGQKPLYINCHSGKDYFTFEQNSKFVELTIEQADKSGIPIAHETHRGRMCFAAHVTKTFLEKYPKMKLTLDISHWTNVHESLLDDQAEAVNLALSRTIHVHSRVGHQEGPQVNDPRAPEWAATFKKHLEWWDVVMKNLANSDAKQFTFLTEFGPPSYMPTVPYTNVPVADQWDINVHMLKLLKARYT